MKRLLLIASLFAVTLAPSGAVQAKNYGVEIQPENVTAISTILAQPEQFLGKMVTVSGTVVGVCEKRGCWVELASDVKFEKLRIKVKDGDMVFPISAKGSQALAMGTLNEIVLDLEHTLKYQKSLAKRRNQTFDPGLITEPMSLYQLVPVGVSIVD